MIKSELRKTYLDRRKNLSTADRDEKNRQIAERFFQNFDLTEIKFLHCFLPIERTGEIDTQIIIRKIRRDFPSIEILVPRVNFQTNEIENLKYTLAGKLKPNQWQIYEPVDDEKVEAQKVEAQKVDAVLIPLLCFDRRGFRVGYGKGFYDKFLKNCRADCLKIGLSYFAPVEKIADAQRFDVKLDFCVTPQTIISFGDKP